MSNKLYDPDQPLQWYAASDPPEKSEHVLIYRDQEVVLAFWDGDDFLDPKDCVEYCQLWAPLPYPVTS